MRWELYHLLRQTKYKEFGRFLWSAILLQMFAS